MSDCIFCKIAAGDIPATAAYQDDQCVAFHDIHPTRPVHLLVIPRRHIASLLEVEAADALLLGHLAVAARLAREHGLTAGYKTQINTGHAGGQEVFHLHIHVLGQPQNPPRFPPFRPAPTGQVVQKDKIMGSFSIWHWVIVLVVVAGIFYTKKLRNVGQDLGMKPSRGSRKA